MIVYKDRYGNPVLGFYWSVPTFDSGDREWDSWGAAFLINYGRNIDAVVCSGGYHLAELEVYRQLVSVSRNVVPLFQEHGFPVKFEML